MHSLRTILPIMVLSATLSAWAADDTTLRVVSVDPPPPYSLSNRPPQTIVVDFNQPVLESSIHDWTVRGIGHNPTLTSPTQLTLDVNPSTPASDYYLTLWADIDYFNDDSALRLALELGDQLTAPPELVAEIRDDLAAIRRAQVGMTSIHARLPWIPGEVLLHLNSYGLDMYQSGTFLELYALNEIYGPVQMLLSDNTLHLYFEGFYHPEILAEIYLIDGVDFAFPYSTFGDGPDIDAEPPFYTFSYGWGDCYLGCMNRRYWEYTVIEGTAVLLDEYGDPLDEPLVPYVFAGLNDRVLDGEFTGSFPSGDGIDGGNFTIRWGWCDLFLEDKDPTLLHYVDSFQVATGLLSDLLSSANFDEATCLGDFDEGPVAVTLPDPPPGEGRYFLARGNLECSAVGFGQSSLPEDPRVALFGVCFSF